MKNIITILLFVVGFTTFAQDSTIVETINPEEISTFERVVDKYSTNIYESVSEGFNNVVTTVTPVAVEGFKIAVRLQIAKGIVNILPLISFIIFSIIYYRYYNSVKRELKKEGDSDPYDIKNVTPFLIILPAITFILGLMSLTFTYSGILYLVAPEWFAVQDIIGVFRK